ncbi:metallophosphoesterase family protein [Rubrivirga sp.]|uniref:metallophosphoesterase family protein n=1 Tax=Rubrivirga sp. TaxID=1885344 RepID=UPI003C71E0FF
MALYAIGDIHGCARTLNALLAAIDHDLGRPMNGNDDLVFVGDYVDRGPDSPAVLDRMIELEEHSTSGRGPQCTFLRGNHDQMMLDYAIGEGDTELWWVNGGRTTLAAYEERGDQMIPTAHVDFLVRTPLAAEGSGFAFVHAGFDTRISIAENLEHPDPAIVLWTRKHLEADLSQWEMPVVCGHTPVSTPVNDPKLIAIDTGAVFAGRPGLGTMTAVALPERRFVTVPTSDVIDG